MTNSVISMHTDQQIMASAVARSWLGDWRICSENIMLFFVFQIAVRRSIVSSRWVTGWADVGMCNFSRRSVEGMGRHCLSWLECHNYIDPSPLSTRCLSEIPRYESEFWILPRGKGPPSLKGLEGRLPLRSCPVERWRLGKSGLPDPIREWFLVELLLTHGSYTDLCSIKRTDYQLANEQKSGIRNGVNGAASHSSY